MYDVRYRDGRNNEADGIQLTFTQTQEIMRRFVKRVFQVGVGSCGSV